MNDTLTLPSIPADWVCHSGILPAGDGFRTHVKRVLHEANGYHPWVIHTAYVTDDGHWAYERGSYFKTKEEGIAAFYKEFNQVA